MESSLSSPPLTVLEYGTSYCSTSLTLHNAAVFWHLGTPQLKLMRPVTDETQSVDQTIHQEIVSSLLCIKIRPYFNHQEFQCHLHCCYSKHHQVLHYPLSLQCLLQVSCLHTTIKMLNFQTPRSRTTLSAPTWTSSDHQRDQSWRRGQ